jgi:general secretion pathway protein D
MKIKRVIIACFLSILLLNFGCATTKLAPKPATLEKETVVQKPAQAEKPPAVGTEETKEKAPAHEVVKPPAFERAAPEKKLPLRKPIDLKSIALAKGPVTINVEKMPLPDFIIYALGETLKVPFVMDQKVMENKEPITFSMPQPMPSDKALEIVLGIFERYNLYAEEKAGALYILHKAPEPKQPFDIRVGREIPESPEQVLQVVPLRYIKPAEIEALLREMYKTNIQIRPYPRENVLLLYGQASQARQIIEFIETFDVPYLQERKISLFKLTYWQMDEFVKQISQIFEGMGFSIARSPKDTGILLIPIKPLGSILAVAPDEKSLSYLLYWKERLDTPEAAGAEERPFVYTPRYTKASDLVKSIKNLYGIMPTPAAPTPATQTRTPTAPTTAPSTATAAPKALKISSDDYKNLIMVVTSPAEYKNILSLLMELDVPPRQVLIEATVAELTLRDELKYGLEWFFRNKMLKGDYTLQTLFSVPTGGPGLVYQFISDSGKFNVAINAFALDDKVNILSTPRLMVLDNQEATIQVGTDIPIITGEVTAADVSQAVPSIMRNIQYRNTGVILRVKPTINTEGLLTLNISQEVSEMGTNPPGINSPTILMRRVNTTVVAAQGETIVLGGLISESKGFTVSKIPILGDIPLLGMLFKTTSKDDKKTELIIFLKPTIITNIDQAAKITNDLKKELKWLK